MQRKTVSLFVLFALVVLSGSPGVSATDDYPPIPAGSRACTSFGLNNNDSLVFGTNFDNTLYEGLLFVNKRNVTKTSFEPGTTGDYARWTSTYGSVTFNLAGYQLPWAGMNEVGLVLSTMALEETQNPAPDERPPLESAVWMQYQLDNSATIDDVIASDSAIRIVNTVDHYLVCDATTACAVIEFLDGGMVAHTGDDLPVSALTNSTYKSSTISWQSATSKPSDNSLGRFYTAAERVMNFEPVDSPEAAVDYAFDTLSMVSNPFTQWSIVFDVENQHVYFRTLSNPEIREVDFSAFDFSCSTPVKMLNIHEELSGEVSDDFIDYAHDVNFAHTYHFLEQWNPGGMPEAVVEQLVGLMEDYPCTE